MITGNSHYRYYLLLLAISFHLIGIFATVSRIGKDKIYLDINSEYFCYRRLNSTHQVGCQSGDNGNVGVLDWVRDENDLKYVEAEGKHLPYIPVLQLQDLTTKIIDRLVISKRVSGVIVVHSNETLPPEGFSPESSCPNDPLSLYNSPDINATQYQHCSAQKWTADNPALNLLYRNYEFPILLVTDETDRNNIFECIEKFGRSEKNPTPSWPLCSAQIFTRMKAAKDARTCMRRNTMFNPLDVPTKYCDPLHSFNIFSPLFDFKPNETLESQSVVILSSRMDSLSFFYDKTPGADSPVTSLVVLLSVIETLANLKPFLEQNRGNKSYNVLFALFNGEVFDYIGSGRMAYDMRTGSFSPFDKSSHKIDIPLLDFKSLNSFIELNQLAAYPGKKDIWIHTDPISCRDPAVNETVDELINILLRTSEEPISIKSAPSDLPLPPASFQSFLRENLSLPGVVLTNHLKNFENKFYHSFLDNYINIGFSANTSDSIDPVTEHLSAISSRVSQSLVQIMTGEYNSSIKANSTTVQNLLHCFLINITCPLLRSYFREQDLKPLKDIDTLPMYIATYGLGRVIPSWWLREVLTITIGLSLGQKTENVSVEECSKLQSSTNRSTFDWIPSANSTNGTCVKSQVFLGEALSPVFLDPDNPRWDLNYSTWTESYWEVPFARIFLKPGNVQESVTMLTGLFITISSIIIMKLFYRFNGVVSKVNAGSSGANLINERNVQC